MLRRRVLADAVAEVEDVAGAVAAIAVQRALDLGTDLRRRREQHVRVEVALQRDAPADALARLAEVDGPVEADHVGAAGGDLLQPEAAALREDDVRDALAVVLLLQLAQHALRVGEAEGLERAV